MSILLHLPHVYRYVTEAVLTFIQKSRRLIVILSPDYLTEKSISLLECRLGLLCQHTDNTRIITVLYKPVGFPSPEALQLKRHTLIKWKGTKSKNPRSKFWKFLRLAIPLRTLASGVRLIDSTSSHSDINVDVRQVKKASPDPYQTRPASKPGPGSSSGGKRFRRRENGCTACKACVSYSEKKPGSAAQGGTAWPVWETRLCKSRTCGAESNWIHSRPTAVSKATLTHGRQLGRSHTHHCCCDISNNNDLCAL
ncbi:uncharacterized protein LOC136753960 [Amia ocellicauda]|uniref:uncharacterized protein LOC136753960 n=1 Tax=Amia ocellicauda TaxID=2972642 RepID=UPI003463A86B